MLNKKLTPEEMSKMYNRVCVLMLQNRRNDFRLHMLLDMLNERLGKDGQPPVDLDEFDKAMGYDPTGIEQKLATEFFDLDLDAE